MRNREIIQYLIYPKIFNAHCIQYKGVFCVAFKIYQITKNNTKNYAYPFPVNLSPFFQGMSPKNQNHSCHDSQNFAYQTQKFNIVFEEDVKFLKSICIFRLEFDLLKNYDIFLSAKLLRKIKNYSQQQIGLCTSKRIENKYEPLDQQIYQIKKQGFNIFQRITFRNCQFFCSLDINICTFNLGYKLYKNKKQLSNNFKNERLTHDNAATILKQKIQVQKNEEVNSYKDSLLQDYSNGLPTYYYQLLNIYKQYEKWQQQCHQLYTKLLQHKQIPQRQLNIPNLSYIIMKSNKINLPQLSFHYQTQQPAQILINILQEKQLLRKNVRYLRDTYCNILISIPNILFNQYINRQILRNQQNIQKIFVRYQKQRVDLTKNLKKQIRQQLVNNYFAQIKLRNQKLKAMPILIVQNYDDQYKKQKNKGQSLTVFVHGYQGNSFDFQKSKNYLKQCNNNTQILIAQSITEDMNQSIYNLGQKVAKEVREHIRISPKTYKTINFIGFSLGGIIARSAFANLKQYWPIFGVLITFSSPHLGLSQSDNNLVNIGVWFLIKVDNVKNLKELNFQSVKFEESLLSKLSMCQGLSSFNKVIVVCSKDDGFVPFYSTVLDEKQCQKQKIKQLCTNMLTTIRRIQRVQLVFDVEKAGTFDKLTGRKGHIQFLENDYFLQTFFRIYGKFL